MDSGITVVGTGQVTAPADVLRLMLSVGHDATDVAAAVAQVAERTDAVNAALREQGVAEKDIHTSSVNVYPQYKDSMKVAGYRALALFTQADLLLQKDDLKGAAAKFAAVAGDSSIGQPLRDLALIRQTAAEFDSLKPDVVVSRLRPLAVKGNPWFGSAGELVASAYLQMNKPDLAGPLFGQIARDDTVPDTIRQRAVQIAGTMGVDAVAPVEEKKAQ